MKRKIPQKQYTPIFYILLVVLLLDRFLHLYLFSFNYVDSDQTILWLAAVEMLQGHFHEPAFYGQAYNTMFEGFLAVPLVAVGVPVYKALPIITAFLAAFPFIFFAFLCKDNNRIAALVFLAIPLLLPVEYVLLTQLPRGFVTGIFGASISVAFLLFTKEVKIRHLLLSGFFGGFALVLSPNSVLLLLPVYLYIFIQHTKKLKVVLSLLLGVLIPLIWQLYVFWFYKTHASYIVHKYDKTSISTDNFMRAITHFHELFYGLFPFLIFAGVGIIFMLLFLAYRLYSNGEKAFSIGIIITLLFIVLTFFTRKINDGSASVFFPYSRMFLALPLVAGIGFYFLFKGSEISAKPIHWFLGITALAVSIKFLSINDRIGWNLHNNSGYVKVFKVEHLKEDYTQIQQIADRLNTSLLIIGEKNDALNYGVMALSSSRLKTISLNYERKVWLVEKEIKNTSSANNPFLFWCENEYLLRLEGLEVERVSEVYPVYKALTPKNPIIFFKEKMQNSKNN